MNNREKLINRLKVNISILENYLIKRPYLREEKCFEAELIKDLILVVRELEKLPTAYDVKKVVRQLEKNKINCNNSNTIFNTDDFVKLDKAIEIVRGGGNDGILEEDKN